MLTRQWNITGVLVRRTCTTEPCVFAGPLLNPVHLCVFMYCSFVFLELFDLTRHRQPHIHPPAWHTPSTHSIREPSPLQRPSSAPVTLVFICSCHNLCDQPGADGPVSVSKSEPLAFLQNHRLAESECQWGVLTWHHHFLKESKKEQENHQFPLKSVFINAESSKWEATPALITTQCFKQHLKGLRCLTTLTTTHTDTHLVSR